MVEARGEFSFALNGREITVRREAPQTTLLDFVRTCGLTGAKEGCAEGECGACAVLMNGRAVNSCLVPLPAAAGQEISTVESLPWCDIHREMAAAGGSQCGYCTPGFIVAMHAGDPGGNLCRCTGYRPIADAMRNSTTRVSPVRSSLSPFRYRGFSRPATLEDALRLAKDDPSARYVAGNTDLGVLTNLRDERFPHLISLEAVPELRIFEDGAGAVEIGAALTLSEIAELWRDAPPFIHEWLDLFASILIRNRATLGGNLVTASPIGDSAPLLLSLNAEVRLAGRSLPLAEFFTGYRRTALEPGGILVSIRIPKPFPAVVRFYKVAKRRADDISTVAAAIARDANGNLRIGLGGVAPTPILVSEHELANLNPIDDHRGSAAYRKAMAQSLLRKFKAGQAVPGIPFRGAGTGIPFRGAGVHAPLSAGAHIPSSLSHESAQQHVTGEALYTDDLTAKFPNLLHAYPALSPYTRALLTNIDTTKARQSEGVVEILTAPFTPNEIEYHNQPIAWVLAESLEAARHAAAKIQADYRELKPILSIKDAISGNSWLAGPFHIQRGNPASELDASPNRLKGELNLGGQEHFYLETQCAIARIDESGGMIVDSSTQHPAETQETVAHVLGIPRNQVTVQCLRMGGAFGGKESQASDYAAVAALGAWKTKRPVRVRLSRKLDMALTGKRHPFHAAFDAGFDDDGRLRALDLQLYSDGGWSLDLSAPVLWRALFHCDNAYLIPALNAVGYVCKTHKTSQTAFRGFGGPQGMLVVEDILSRIAQTLKLPFDVVRERNFYRQGDITHYTQPVKDADRIARIWTELKQSSDFEPRRRAVAAFNAAHEHSKRGIAITPVKFGISFTATFYNQAGALVLVYRDGTVQVNHGGTEMGQGIQTKIRRIAAETLGVGIDSIRCMPARTDKIPNTSPTAASAGTDLNGAAVADACRQIKQRLDQFAAGREMPFAELVDSAYKARIPLFAHGYYRTPEIHFDPKTATGKPFHYFAYGAAVSEVEIDGFTGDSRILRADLLEDVGDSVAPLIDQGQIEGGFIQGLGWLTLEELVWDSRGRLATNGASTYKLPSWTEMPEMFNVSFLDRAEEPGVVFGSKAVGEPPLMMAISVREAIREAIAAFGPGAVVTFDSPATPERIYWAIQAVRAARRPLPEHAGAASI